MRTFILIRQETSDQGTFGILVGEKDNVLFQTGELPRFGGNPGLENERCLDCIPPGTYTAEITQSPRFGRVYLLKNVPGRSAILIHAGNYCGNRAKGYKSDVEGCILLGKAQGVLNGQKVVLDSKRAVKEFMALTGGEPIRLKIQDINAVGTP